MILPTTPSQQATNGTSRAAAVIAESRTDHAHANTTAGLLLALAGLAVSNPYALPSGPVALAGYVTAYTAIGILLAVFIPRIRGHSARRWANTDTATLAGELSTDPDTTDQAARIREMSRITVRKYRLVQTAVVCLVIAATLFGSAAITT